MIRPLGFLASVPDIKLLFTDIGLPGPFNGRQLADEARKRRPDIKVLFTTGHAHNAIIHHGQLDSRRPSDRKTFPFLRPGRQNSADTRERDDEKTE